MLAIVTVLLVSLSITTIYAQSDSIPSWVRTNALWWGQGQISDADYLQGLQYLITNKMLRVSQTFDTSVLDNKIKSLESENHELRNNVIFLENENKRLRSVIDNTNASPKQPTQSYNSYNCSGSAKCVSEKITRIVDGDTIYTTNYKVRLSLTNTPEKNESGFSEAMTFTARMCPVGSIATIDQDDLQFYDKYGRMLANVYCGEKLLNSELLYNGHATILTQYCNDSEFSSESWAQKFGCGSRSSMPVNSSDSDKSSQTTKLTSKCDPSYPDFCIPPPPPDLDCKDIPQKRFTVLQPDPHRFDGDKDGIGCES